MKQVVKIKIEGLMSRKRKLLSESEASYLMTLVKKYIELLDEENKKKFATLRFFCDWSLHIAIDRSIPAMEILKEINSTIYLTPSRCFVLDTSSNY